MSPPLPFNIAKGQESNEAKIQAARVLDSPPYKFTNHLPASPSEPSEMTVDYDDSKVPIIPLEDITSLSSQNNANIQNNIPNNNTIHNINTPMNFNFGNNISTNPMNNIPNMQNINIPNIPNINMPMNNLPINSLSLNNFPINIPNIPNIPNLPIPNALNNPLFNTPNYNNPLINTAQSIPPVDPMQLLSLLYNNNLQNMNNVNMNNINMNNNMNSDYGNTNNNNYNNNNNINNNSDDKSQQICRFHTSPGGCKRGKYCEYRHV